jgi:hypothetical protein
LYKNNNSNNTIPRLDDESKISAVSYAKNIILNMISTKLDLNHKDVNVIISRKNGGVGILKTYTITGVKKVITPDTIDALNNIDTLDEDTADPFLIQHKQHTAAGGADPSHTIIISMIIIVIIVLAVILLIYIMLVEIGAIECQIKRVPSSIPSCNM